MKKVPIIIVLLFFSSSYLQSLPTYSFRSARVCDNCHATPFQNKNQQNWENPVQRSRKCNMSCQTCHINPAGGGLRTASGRYYSLTTLPTWGAKKRPYHDKVKNREIWQLKDQILNFIKPQDEKASKSFKSMKATESKKIINKPPPPNIKRTKGSYYVDDYLSFGAPLDTNGFANQSKYALQDKRYGTINPDPFITVGTNTRLAVYSSSDFLVAFPMQFDVGSTIHPVEHVSFSATAGLQGRSDTDTSRMNVKLQNAFLLVHELPYMGYFQAGYFLPEFGLRTDDHTMYGRQYFEMSNIFSDYNVVGAKIGAAPNYPYISFAAFQTIDRNYVATGLGYSANFAYRSIEWGLGSSYLQKNRAFNKGGNLFAASFNGYYNLWSLWKSSRYYNPILFQFEINIGHKSRSQYSMKSYSTVIYMLDYLIFNGFNMRMAYMYYDQDFALKKDGIARGSIGFDWTIVRFLRLSFDFRVVLPDSGEASPEIITFIQGYM